MSKIKLTKTNIKALPVREKEYFQSDSEEQCFGVKVFPSGRKAYYLYGKVKGRKINKKLAEVGTSDVLEDIRQMANEKMHEWLHPKKETKEHLVSELAEKVWEYYESRGRDAKYVQNNKDRYRDKIAPHFKNTLVTEVTREAVENFLHLPKMAAHPVDTNRVYRLFRFMMNRAIKMKWITHHDIGGIEEYPEHGRKVFATKNEQKDIWGYLKDDDKYHLAIKIMTLTGCRHHELFAAKITDFRVDDGRMIWSKPPTNVKQGVWHQVVLSEHAKDCVETAIKLAAEDEDVPENNIWLFPCSKTHPSKSGHIEGVKHVWADIRKDLKLHHLNAYDMRKTFATNLRSRGVSLDDIAEFTGHVETRTLEERYAMLETERQSAILDQTTPDHLR